MMAATGGRERGPGPCGSCRHSLGLPRVCALLAALALSVLWHPPPAVADAFGGEVTILTIHVLSQRDAPVELYERRLDSKGRFVLTPGVELYYDFDLDEPLWKARQIRIAGGQISDSIRHRLGYVAVMGRWVLWEGERAAWSLQLGPGLLYRGTWTGTPGYDPDNALRETESFLPGYEWALLPLGDVDFLYRFTPELQGVWSIFPGLPYVVMQSLGLRWTF